MLSKYWNDKNGNFGIALVAASMALVPAIGFSVDLTNQLRSNTDLQNSVDSATLMGAKLLQEGGSEAAVKEAVTKTYMANCQIAPCSPGSLDIKILGGSIEVTSNERMPTTFMSMFGTATMGLEAKARVGIPTTVTQDHIEVHLVIDNTGSMNIVDGVAAINRMKPLFLPYEKYGVMEQCAFACHITTDGANADVTYNGRTGAEIARANGIPMREDRVHNEMIDQATRLLAGNTNIEVAVHAFTWGLNTLQNPTRRLDRVRSAIDAIVNSSQGTKHEQMAPEADRKIGRSRDGRNRGQARKIVVLVTDGVTMQDPDQSPKPITLAACDTLKQDDRELYVLNIAYPDPRIIGGDQRPTGSPAKVAAFYGQLEPRLKECASSPDNYFRADYGVSIDRALEKITDQILNAGTSGNFYLSL